MSDDDTNSNWCARNSHQGIGTRTGGLTNKMVSGDYSNSISARILRRVLET